MSTLRRIQAISMRVAPQWFFCVFIGAYVAMKLLEPSAVIA